MYVLDYLVEVVSKKTSEEKKKVYSAETYILKKNKTKTKQKTRTHKTKITNKQTKKQTNKKTKNR